MTPTRVTPENANAAGAVPPAARPLVVAAADAHDVMRDQLECLIEHAQDGVCGCDQCGRYLRARALLMELFPNSQFAVVKKKAAAATN